MDKSRERRKVSPNLGLTPSHHHYCIIIYSSHSIHFFFHNYTQTQSSSSSHKSWHISLFPFSIPRDSQTPRLRPARAQIEEEKAKRFDLSIEGFLGCPRMRLNGEISSGEEEEKQTGTTTFSSQKVVVGYALTSKKKKSFLQPSFTGLAR